MGKEVMMSDYCDDDGEDAGGDEDRVPEWEIGLPNGDDLTSLSQSLVPSILALAFSIIPERSRTIHDVNRASQTTLSSLQSSANASSVMEEVVDRVGSSSPGSNPKKQKKSDGGEAAAVEESTAEEGDSGTEDASGKTLKRPRLVWTPQLHKRFVDVVAHLGIKNAVPKTIMQLMNVEGLTRENVASHLQKYRLYLKRIQGLTTEEDPYSSDQLFSSTPVPPQSFQDGGGSNGKLGIPVPVPSMIPMPGYGNQMSMQGHYHQYRNQGNESNQYMMQRNKFGTMVTSPSVGGGDVNDK
ncbi:Homeobox-like domain superfamily [Arabidopsis thaliana x Arabidopsis arenosa]|uniref:Homeobox-like domain superfamily n=1 Tax=Arabidopsis thaliana x Arabidopsis arenosa TaxID=1240361 RepID=A0A8T1XUL5_9BRAS|nr:Homeobox-like domain superfamily [Arabidopsis thaliana x Arabidopsis arenosa]